MRGANGELLDEEEQLRLAIEASLSNVVAAPPAPPAQPLQAAIVVPDTLDPDAFDDSFTTPAVSRPRTTVAVAAGRAAEHRRAAGQPTPAPPTGRRLAKRIRQGETLVIWTTPLGLPIVQPYRRRHVRQIRTSLQMIQVNDPAQQTAVHVTRQRSAFPPNFIHSLDSTHMLMTALACRRLKVRATF